MFSPIQNSDTNACCVARARTPDDGDNVIKKFVVNNDLKAGSPPVSVGNSVSNAQAPPTLLEVPPISVARSVDNLHFVQAVPVPQPSEALQGNVPPPFLSKTYDMVDDPATSEIVSWSTGNNSFVVWKTGEFARDLLPKYFKHSNFSSFVRQLNTYGFRKVDPDRSEFANEGFLRGHKYLLASIQRRRSMCQQHQPGNLSQGSCVELGKFGGLGGEIERLKRDKNVLVLELVRMRQQQQQATRKEMNLMMQRLHTTEQRQQQMMSFLARAMQNPTFVAHLIQQNENSDMFAGKENSKKRCLENDGNESDHDISVVSSPMDGQMVKYEVDLTSLNGLPTEMEVQANPLHDLYDKVYLEALGQKNISHVIGRSECESTLEMVTLPDDKDNGCVNRGELTSDLFWEHFLFGREEATNPVEVSDHGQSPLNALNTYTDNKDVPPHNLMRSSCILQGCRASSAHVPSTINQLTDNISQTL